MCEELTGRKNHSIKVAKMSQLAVFLILILVQFTVIIGILLNFSVVESFIIGFTKFKNKSITIFFKPKHIQNINALI